MASNFTLTSGSYDGRYLQLYCSQSKDIATNRSKITWKLSSIGGTHNYYSTGPTSVTIAGVEVYSCARKNWDSKVFPAAKGNTSGTIYVDHDSKGEKSISVSFTTAIYVGATSTYEGKWTLDDIPRQAELTSAPDFTDLDNPTISYKNPAGNSVKELMACISLTKAKDDIKYRDISKTGTSYTFNLTDEERDLLRNNTTSGSRKIHFFIRTKIGSNTFHASKEITLTIVENENTKPTVSMVTTLNNGSLPSQFNGLYIQGKSKLQVELSATGKYNATIQSYSAVLDEKTYTSASFTTDVIQSIGDILIVGYAKDSRQFTGSTSKPINVLPYSKPLVIPIGSENAILCYRSDGNGARVGNSTSVWIKAKRYYQTVTSNSEQKNFCALQWRKKFVNEAWDDNKHLWQDLIPKTDIVTTEYNAMLPNEVFEPTKSYTVQIRAIDDIGEKDVKTFEVPTEDVALHLGKGGKNVSIGTYCNYSKKHTFYSEWDAYFDKDVYVGDNKIVDFPIEQGTSGIWTYEKRNSGIAECWGQWTGKLTNYTSTNNFYVYVKIFKFPDGLFVSSPIPTYGAAVGNAICCSGLVLNLSKESMSCFALAIIGGENDVTFYIHAKGKWK